MYGYLVATSALTIAVAVSLAIIENLRRRLVRLEKTYACPRVITHRDIFVLQNATFLALRVAAKDIPTLDLDAFFRADVLELPLRDVAQSLGLTVDDVRERALRVRKSLDQFRTRRFF